MTGSETIRTRYAARNYTMKLLSPAVIDGLKEEIDQCNQLGQLHIQLVAENGEAFRSMIPLLGRFEKVKNYITLAAKKQDGFYAECGYYGARLMVKAQQADLNSCWVTNTYSAKKYPVSLEPHGELTDVIAISYSVTDGTQRKSKSTGKLRKPRNGGRFIDGVNVAAFAPTSLNKQNSFVEASGNTVSIRPKDNCLIFQINIGIVEYHFEVGTGRENFIWK